MTAFTCWRTLRSIWRRGKEIDIIRTMTQPKGIVNPILWSDIDPGLTGAERAFADCLSRGGLCKLGGAVPQQSADDIRIRPEVICFFAFGGDSNHQVRGPRICLAGAYICGEYDMKLPHVDIPYVLDFTNCHFATAVNLQYASCEALYLRGSHLAKGLVADGLRTKGSVLLRDGFKAKGVVALSRARIDGDLDCTKGEFCNPNGRALVANQTTIKEGAFLHDGFSASGEVRMVQVRVGGDFDCRSGEFSNLEGIALSADGMTVGGSICFNGNFSAEGVVRLPGAKAVGNLDCSGGRFHNPGRLALSVSGIKVQENAFLCHNFSSEGLTNMVGASIGGNLDCAGGCFHNPNGKYALNAERVTIGGHVFLNQYLHRGDKPFSARGRVRFANADIGRNFNCKGGQFSHVGDKSAIAAGGLRSRGAVFLSDGFAVQGDVDLHVARIGNFVCQKCGPTIQSTIDLSSTEAVAIDDDSDSWGKFEFLLDDFTYGAFYGRSPTDSKRRLKWLGKRPQGIGFSPHPYEQAARVLRNMGRDVDAWDIEREKKRLQREADGVSWVRKCGDWIVDTLQDAVYRPRRTVRWALSVVAIGAAVFALADYHGHIVPTHPVVTLSEDYRGNVAPHGDLRPTQAVPPEYPAFHPVAFSLDVFTPSAVFRQEDSWGPRSGGGDWWSLGDFGVLWLLMPWYWFQIAAGWILIPLFLLSITGLLRPRQSSGEKG